ncbi:ATP-binding protein, partial [Salinimicrobium oceani]
ITDFDLPLLLNNLKQAHQPQAIDKQTRLDLHIDDKIPHRVAADQLKLSQVLHNLVSNAVKFTEAGKVNISVELQKQENETLWLKFDIEDTGIGISEDKIEHIFEKFTQAESS